MGEPQGPERPPAHRVVDAETTTTVRVRVTDPVPPLEALQVSTGRRGRIRPEHVSIVYSRARLRVTVAGRPTRGGALYEDRVVYDDGASGVGTEPLSAMPGWLTALVEHLRP